MHDFRLFGLVRASLRWLVLGLAIAVVDTFYYDNAERLRISRQIKLPVVDAHGIQITRLYLKYNALYYIHLLTFPVFAHLSLPMSLVPSRLLSAVWVSREAGSLPPSVFSLSTQLLAVACIDIQ